MLLLLLLLHLLLLLLPAARLASDGGVVFVGRDGLGHVLDLVKNNGQATRPKDGAQNTQGALQRSESVASRGGRRRGGPQEPEGVLDTWNP